MARTLGAAAALAAPRLARPAPAHPGHPVIYKKTVIDPEFRSEGVTLADVNRDGKLDIVAGNLWYAAPKWTPHTIAPLQKFDPAKGYSNSFLDFALDIDGDGWLDEIVFGFPGREAFWRQNPAGKEGPWKEYPIAPHATSESPALAHLFPGKPPVLVFGTDPHTMAWFEPGTDFSQGFVRHVLGETPANLPIPGHGLGVGDINGDGRPEVITPVGYWDSPRDPRAGPWKFVAANLGPACAQMLVYDVNGDGVPDLLTSSAHNIGLWWFEQRRGPNGSEFIQHVIDESFSQSHALVLADINGDGVMDLVTGKRFWAHGPEGDVRPADPCVLYWFELRRGQGKVEWVKHEIDNDSGVGTQFAVADVNGDGLPEIVVANKKGVFLFEQQRPGRQSR